MGRSPPARPIRVLLVDGEISPPAVDPKEIRLVGHTSAAGAVQMVDSRRPDIVVLGWWGDGDEVLRLIRRLRAAAPEPEVVVTGAESDAQTLLRALESGARGYLPRSGTSRQLTRVLRAVTQGEPAFPRSLLGPLVDSLVAREEKRQGALQRVRRLTRREASVLALLAEGAGSQAIAGRLEVSPLTVRKHVQHVMRKLGVHSRLEAVAFIHRHGVLDDVRAAAKSPQTT
jgi:two-component system, NarL family, nitrate/nitrite response regulator NarL